MNITLTQADADFILKYIRMDARRVEERYETLQENENNLRKAYEKANLTDRAVGNAIMEVAEELSTNVKNDLIELRKDFTKCIELLTVGSEVTE